MMATRVDQATATDPVVRWLATAGLVLAVIVALVLARAELGAGVRHVTVRVDNPTSLTLDVDVVDSSGATVDLGSAQAGSVTSFEQAVDLGARWTFVASYGSRELDRQTVSGTQLAEQGWTVHIPRAVTVELERAGFQ